MPENTGDSASSRIGNAVDSVSKYAKDVWNNPQDHMLEIGVGAITAASLAIPGARAGARLLGEFMESRAATGAMAKLTSEAVPGLAIGDAAAATAASDTGFLAGGGELMNAKALAKAVDDVKKLSFEVEGGFSNIIGKLGPDGSRTIGTADGRALKLRPLNESERLSTYAHEVELPAAGDKFTARYFIDKGHSNPWGSMDRPVWPAGKTGPLAGLDQAGIHVSPYTHTPMQLEYTNALKSLEIRATTEKPIYVALDNLLEGRGVAASGGGVQNLFSEISISAKGPQAVRHGQGLIEARNANWPILANEYHGYPAVQAGGTLRVYRNPDSNFLPQLAPDVRRLEEGRGLMKSAGVV